MQQKEENFMVLALLSLRDIHDWNLSVEDADEEQSKLVNKLSDKWY